VKVNLLHGYFVSVHRVPFSFMLFWWVLYCSGHITTSNFVLQGDLEDIAMLFLDAKASARLLQQQPDKYVSQ
jgi:hypothetical protein